jgi:hypothetical protein
MEPETDIETLPAFTVPDTVADAAVKVSEVRAPADAEPST